MNFHLSQRPLNSNCVDLLKVFGMVQAVQGALRVMFGMVQAVHGALNVMFGMVQAV